MNPVPKPKHRKQAPRFGKRHDMAYRRWIATQYCLLQGTEVIPVFIERRMSSHDTPVTGGFWHSCWGPIDPAHVGKHQATGANDRKFLVPLCRAAHQFYDEHRSLWRSTTGYTAHEMYEAAKRYDAAYERQS